MLSASQRRKDGCVYPKDARDSCLLHTLSEKELPTHQHKIYYEDICIETNSIQNFMPDVYLSCIGL